MISILKGVLIILVFHPLGLGRKKLKIIKTGFMIKTILKNKLWTISF